MCDLTKVRLIASDLDGTLLYPLGTQTLKEGTCGLIREWLDLGKIFVASSGRQYANLRNIFEPIKDDIAYICENGCLTVFKGKTISMDSIERPLAEQLSRDILAQEKGELLISCADMQYVIPKEEEFFYYMRDTVGVQVRISATRSSRCLLSARQGRLTSRHGNRVMVTCARSRPAGRTGWT